MKKIFCFILLSLTVLNVFLVPAFADVNYVGPNGTSKSNGKDVKLDADQTAHNKSELAKEKGTTNNEPPGPDELHLNENDVTVDANGNPVNKAGSTSSNSSVASTDSANSSNGSSAPAAGGSTDDCEDGVKLNTDVPFIGHCISKTESGGGSSSATVENAFPKLIGGLSKIVITLILVVAFLAIIYAGMIMSMSGGQATLFNKGKDLIKKVVLGLIILGASGLILHVINPNVFK